MTEKINNNSFLYKNTSSQNNNSSKNRSQYLTEQNNPKNSRKFFKKVRRFIQKVFIFILKYPLAFIYIFYFWFVWKTSEIITEESGYIDYISQKSLPNQKARIGICCLWHQDVVFTPWAFKHLRPHTIANVGCAGEIISCLLKLLGFTVFRGGSTKRKKEHVPILDDFLQHLSQVKETTTVGITVDGASGPRYRMKRGTIVMSMETDSPIALIRVWCKRRINLSTWDETTIPLPFNKIVILWDYLNYPPSDKENPDAFNNFHRCIEEKLLDLAYRSFIAIDGEAKSEWLRHFPEYWKPKI